MDQLITWLRAQLDDDERAARAAPGPKWVRGVERKGEPGRWRGVKADLVMLPPDGPFVMDLDVGTEVLRAEFVNDGKSAGSRAVDHAARWDPARVLAEVEAKQRLLDYLVDLDSRAASNNWWSLDTDEPIKLLAQPYAGRHGWREEWRISGSLD